MHRELIRWYYLYIDKYSPFGLTPYAPYMFYFILAIVGYFVLKVFFKGKKDSSPAARRKQNQGGELDFYGKDVKLVTDVNAGTIHISRPNQELTLPVEHFYYYSIEVRHSVSGEKIASGIAGGKLVTMRTGEYYDYKVPNGMHDILVKNTKTDAYISFQEDAAGLAEFKEVASKIYKLGNVLKERKQKEDELRAEAELRAELEAVEKANLDKEERKKKAEERLEAATRAFIEECQFDPGSTRAGTFTQDEDGNLMTAIAADSTGRGGLIYNQGKDKWIGSWKGAKVEVSGNNLEILLDDPDYRAKKFTERRVTMEFLSKPQRLEWYDRINILSKI